MERKTNGRRDLMPSQLTDIEAIGILGTDEDSNDTEAKSLK